jgi:integrase
VRVPLGNGKYKTGYFKTEREAERARRRWLNELEQGKLVTAKDQLLKDYLLYWLDIKQASLREVTLSTYARYMHYRLIPVLGHVKLQKLTGDMIQLLYSNMLKDGYSQNTVRLVHRVLNCALNDAVKWKKIASNPAKEVSPPSPVRREMHVLDLEQAKVFLEAAKKSRYDCLLTLALVTGMRRGELLALRWSDVDFDRAQLSIHRSLSYFSDPKTGHHKFKEEKTKTAAGKRLVSLPDFVIDSLWQHRKQQAEERLKCGDAWLDYDLVFCTQHGSYLDRMNVVRVFKKILKEAGLPDMRFHDLRHSAATILLSMGVNAKIVQELLGHGSITITLDVYSHVLPSMQRSVMEDLNSRYLDRG